ncbi:MAG: septum formation initiator family protein [Prolixibacteraceae bacterium]|nr:septum formation initiator family protein [Prolixibacteraceae bacterium]
MRHIVHIIWVKVRNKYFLVFVSFLIWIMFFDEHSLLQHYQNREKLRQLEEQEEFYREKIEADKRKLHELQTNDENLEKFAREQFQMKKENEDIFVIIEEK